MKCFSDNLRINKGNLEKSSNNHFLEGIIRKYYLILSSHFISTSIRVIILKQKSKDAHISKFKPYLIYLFNFMNNSTEPSARDIYPDSENIKHFLNKQTFMSLISPTLTELEI